MSHEAIKVLDHGLIRLVDSMGSDLSISRNARVSYDAEPRAKDVGLIDYLYNNRHNTPFESLEIQFEVRAPIFVFRQWHRHRTQSYNELSARYRELPEVFYVPELDQITMQSTDNKQMRTNEQHPNSKGIQQLIKMTNESAFVVYRQLIKDGCPRELARSVLPMGTYSHMFAKTDLHNWFGFLSERLHIHAQYEIRVFAIEILKILETIAPIAVSTFKRKMAEVTMVLTTAEVESGLTRQQAAEGLILQLPEYHDGRNTWLLNYGEKEAAEYFRKHHSSGEVKWNNRTNAAETIGEK